ncbi:MAG: inositol monophosphatase family protein, partial [Pseudomonadota bacterium]
MTEAMDRSGYEAIGEEMRRLALLAGAETLKFFGDADLAVEAKADDSPVSAADHAADKIIAEGLIAAFPDIPTVTEERAESHNLDHAARFFLVDPLDGT